MNKELIDQVVALEWQLFQNVANVGGRAACQDNHETFSVMRSSQITAWSAVVLDSYLRDLTEAKAQGRNLLTEKYARMMEFTAPGEYARIQHHLPQLEQQALLLIERIVEIHMAWNAEISDRFPDIRKRGRPASSTGDMLNITSVETYLRGELATYSPRTLELYYQNALEQKDQNINGAQIVLDAMVQQYGFLSLAEANKAMKR